MDALAARRLFDRNAPDYDRVNTVISLGLDEGWRRWAARQAVGRPGERVLDAFAGTGRVGVECAALGARVTLADTSPGMLERATRYAAQRGVEVRELLTDLSAERLPFEDSSFDAITVSFGIRYLDRPAEVLARFRRLLAPHGRLVVLEFVRPARGHPVSWLAALYFFRLLPRLAARLSGRSELYDYLVQSVRRIGHEGDLAHLLGTAGYEVAGRERLGFGLVAGFVCLPSG